MPIDDELHQDWPDEYHENYDKNKWLDRSTYCFRKDERMLDC